MGWPSTAFAAPRPTTLPSNTSTTLFHRIVFVFGEIVDRSISAVDVPAAEFFLRDVDPHGVADDGRTCHEEPMHRSDFVVPSSLGDPLDFGRKSNAVGCGLIRYFRAASSRQCITGDTLT